MPREEKCLMPETDVVSGTVIIWDFVRYRSARIMTEPPNSLGPVTMNRSVV